MKFDTDRIDESRQMLVQSFFMGLGAYTEQEAKKKDQWRDQSYRELYQHTKHEFQEVERSKDLTKQIHNLHDLVTLSTMLLAKVLLEHGYFNFEKGKTKLKQALDDIYE